MNPIQEFLLRILGSRASYALDKLAVRFFGGSFAESLYDKMAGVSPLVPCLLLITRGHVSGRERSVVLPYYVTEGKMFVIGSWGGAPRDPAWATNLRRTPQAKAYIDRRAKRVRARVAIGGEREVLWSSAIAWKPVYAQYQRKTTREIPLFVLEADVGQPAP
ncbi:MAG: nitroreductase/quinone reductase family protein [Steroidobacteraceae bacterium]